MPLLIDLQPHELLKGECQLAEKTFPAGKGSDETVLQALALLL